MLPLTRVAPGQSIGLLINTSCGPEYWKEVLYSISATGNPVASSANPSGLCGPDVGSVDCLGSTITATWSIAGAGNATVSLK